MNKLILHDELTVLHLPQERHEEDKHRMLPAFRDGFAKHHISWLLDLDIWQYKRGEHKAKAALYLVHDGSAQTENSLPIEVIDKRTNLKQESSSITDKAYKLASSFYLSSMHDDWSGSRIRKAVLVDIDGDDEQAIADQKELKPWHPIARHIEYNCSAMDDPAEILDDLIQNLADSFVQFAEENQNLNQ